MLTLQDRTDFATIKSLFPHVPDTMIEEHLKVYISGERLSLISNLLIDYEDTTKTIIQKDDTACVINNFNNFGNHNKLHAMQSHSYVNTFDYQISSNSTPYHNSITPTDSSQFTNTSACHEMQQNSNNVSKFGPTMNRKLSHSYFTNDQAPISSKFTNQFQSHSGVDQKDTLVSTTNKLHAMQSHSYAPNSFNYRMFTTLPYHNSTTNSNQSTNVSECHKTQQNTNNGTTFLSTMNRKRSYSSFTEEKISKFSNHCQTITSVGQKETKVSPTKQKCSSSLSHSSSSSLHFGGFGFDYGKPKKSSSSLSKKCHSVLTNVTIDDSNIPTILNVEKTQTASKSADWTQIDCCLQELKRRFPFHLDFYSLKSCYDLMNNIQDIENCKYSPTYDKNAADSEDHYNYKWYWKNISCHDNVGKLFESWSQDKLEKTYQIQNENTEYIKIFLRKDKKLEAFQVHFCSMRLMRGKDEWFITRLKVRKPIKDQKEKQSEVDVVYPSTWTPQHDDRALFPVADGSPEWNSVFNLFKQTLQQNARVTVCNIQRVQNKWLWKKYYLQKKLMSEKNGKDNINEKRLFHGTRQTDPLLIWKGEDGFDLRYCQRGSWGKGSYFAEQAAYSINYAHQKYNGEGQLFLANVLTGFNCCTAANPSLQLPPVRHEKSNGIQSRYNSVSGISGGIKIYVVYQLDVAYPTHLITFKRW